MSAHILNEAKKLFLNGKEVKAIYYWGGVWEQVWPAGYFVKDWGLYKLNSDGEWEICINSQGQEIRNVNLMSNLIPNETYTIFATVKTGTDAGVLSDQEWTNVPVMIHIITESTIFGMETDYFYLEDVRFPDPLNPSVPHTLGTLIHPKDTVGTVENSKSEIIGAVFLLNSEMWDQNNTTLWGWSEEKKYIQRAEVWRSMNLDVYINGESTKYDTSNFSSRILKSGDYFTIYPAYYKTWSTGKSKENISGGLLLDPDTLPDTFSSEYLSDGGIKITVNSFSPEAIKLDFSSSEYQIRPEQISLYPITQPKYLYGAAGIGGKRVGDAGMSTTTSVTIYEDSPLSVWRSETDNPIDLTKPTTTNYTVDFENNQNYVSWDSINHKVIVNNPGTCRMNIYIDEGRTISFELTYAIPESVNIDLKAYSDYQCTNLIYNFGSWDTTDSIRNLGNIDTNSDIWIKTIVNPNVSLDFVGSSGMNISQYDNLCYIGGTGTISIKYNGNVVATFTKSSYTPPEPECTNTLTLTSDALDPSDINMNQIINITATYNTICDGIITDTENVTSKNGTTWEIRNGSSHLTKQSTGSYKWTSGSGEATIRVTYNGISQWITFNRTPDITYRLDLIASKTTLNAGESTTITAKKITEYDGTGTGSGEDVTNNVTWSVNNSNLSWDEENNGNVFAWAGQGTTIVTATYSGLSKSITITTNAAPEVSVSTDRLTFDDNGGRKTFTIVSTGNWLIEKQDYYNFITVGRSDNGETSGGVGTFTINVDCDASSVTYTTDATILVKLTYDSSLPKYVNIIREGVNPYVFEATSPNPSISGTETEFQVTLRSTKNGNALPITGDDISIDPITGNGISNIQIQNIEPYYPAGEYIIFFSCDANTSTVSQKQSKITISHPETTGVNPIEYIVTQGVGEAGPEAYLSNMTTNPSVGVYSFKFGNTHPTKSLNVSCTFRGSPWSRIIPPQTEALNGFEVGTFSADESLDILDEIYGSTLVYFAN